MWRDPHAVRALLWQRADGEGRRVCTIPSRLHARCRANASEKTLVANSLSGPPVWVFRTMVPRQRSSRLLKDNSVREKSTATHGKTSHVACAVPTPVTKRDKKNAFLVFSPPKFGSACRTEATFLPVRFANAGSMFALKLPTTKRTTCSSAGNGDALNNSRHRVRIVHGDHGTTQGKCAKD